MITFKCKMCGGDLEFEQGATVVECPYCGSRQTLPKLDNDKRANMYDRANHFRRQNEYDKAMAIYEQILQEDRTDAEAYWSLVLCRYGIEYVEDPASHKRMPTVNRVQYTSVLADEDYKSALQYADAGQRTVYEGEAKAIDEIQKGILEISKQEKPFDVFICYKETDANGRRTPDSVLANDLYHQLTNEGFKVFFSRITLEDKIGTAYEPYIFAALNSAKVMVVLGTKPEYFNAVWVKNEWSRYLALIRAGADKVLVPAYRDMDPYDLPDEFSHLQAQDMGKLGFMQDLIRGIKKILRRDEPKPQTAAQQTISVGANIDNLMKRARLFMEDGDWTSANEYLDRVLDENAEYAPAYVGKVQVELKKSMENELSSCLDSFEESPNWKKAIRFATPAQKEKYEQILCTSYTAREEKRKERVYQEAKKLLNNASSFDDFEKAKQLFESITGFCDADDKRKMCLEALNACVYQQAVKLMEKASKYEEYDEAKQLFESIEGYSDADDKRKVCVEAFNACVYQQAVKLMEEASKYEEYDEAKRLFESIEGYLDADVRQKECIEEFNKLKLISDYKRAEAKYSSVIDESPDIEAADELERIGYVYTRLGSFRDSKEKGEKCFKRADEMRQSLYDYACSRLDSSSISSVASAEVIFRGLAPKYKDSSDKVRACAEKTKEIRLEQEKLKPLFDAASDSLHRATTIEQCIEVKKQFQSILNYDGVIRKMAECDKKIESIKSNIYDTAKSYQNKGEWDLAISTYDRLGGYKDSRKQITICSDAKANDEKKQQLRKKKEQLEQDLSQLHGLFTGKRRKEILSAISEVERELRRI